MCRDIAIEREPPLFYAANRAPAARRNDGDRSIYEHSQICEVLLGFLVCDNLDDFDFLPDRGEYEWHIAISFYSLYGSVSDCEL